MEKKLTPRVVLFCKLPLTLGGGGSDPSLKLEYCADGVQDFNAKLDGNNKRPGGVKDPHRALPGAKSGSHVRRFHDNAKEF